MLAAAHAFQQVLEQHGDHQGDCEDNSWRLGTPYEDSSVSASRCSRKRRNGFHELIDDLEYDQFGAQVLILCENSRGSRRVGEWLNLIELCALRSVFIWVHTHGRLYAGKVTAPGWLARCDRGPKRPLPASAPLSRGFL